MAYQLNSANDSRGDEHLFVERFNQNLQAIKNYKSKYGGDLESAYRAVTGESWPAGRSVKISDGVGEMTKDRTVKSVLGKYVAPIAAAVVAPFALPALLGGGAAAAGGAAAGGSVAGGTAAGFGTGALVKSALVAGGFDLFGSLFQGRAATRSAELQAQAQIEAARIQKQAADEALAETRREADRLWASNEAARRGNYDQWRDREERLSAGGQSVGLPARTISDYVPDPGGSEGSGTTTDRTVPDRPSDLQTALDVANKTAYGYAKHTDPSYWAALWQKDPEYAFRRMLGEQAGPSDAPKMGPYAGTSTAATRTASTITPYGTIGDLATPAWRRRSPRTPALTPGSVAEYAVGRY